MVNTNQNKHDSDYWGELWKEWRAVTVSSSPPGNGHTTRMV